jgi:hypothetical protein
MTDAQPSRVALWRHAFLDETAELEGKYYVKNR